MNQEETEVVEQTKQTEIPVPKDLPESQVHLWRLVDSVTQKQTNWPGRTMQHIRAIVDIIVGTFSRISDAPPEIVEQIVTTATIAYLNQLQKDRVELYGEPTEVQ